MVVTVVARLERVSNQPRELLRLPATPGLWGCSVAFLVVRSNLL